MLQNAQNILELGSGEGSYLNMLSQNFQGKTFNGFELLAKSVKHADAKYGNFL